MADATLAAIKNVEDWDPISGYRYEMAEVFAHPPADFEITPWKLTWESPCWVWPDIILRPLTPATKKQFFANLSMPHKVDAFAKTAWEDQLWATFGLRLDYVTGPYASDWFSALLDCYDKLKANLRDTDMLFTPPFRFAGRQEYTDVDLTTILQKDPETLSIYTAIEKGSYRDYEFLRIHSSAPIFGSHPKLWFEKRVPNGLHPEDVIPWFEATIRRLPKKHQPATLNPWTDRLLQFEPLLAPPQTGADKRWAEKPKIIIVFGATGKVGHRGMFHFERCDISQIVRQKDVIRIEGKTRHPWANNTTTEMERTAYLLAFDEQAAERVERQLFRGDRVHFGLDSDVLGIFSRSGHIIHAINAPIETIRRQCVEPELDLHLLTNPREKEKIYTLVDPKQDLHLPCIGPVPR